MNLTTSLPSVDVPIAVFDLDKTLTVRDCVLPFMRRVAGVPRLIATAVRHAPVAFLMLVKRDRDGLKELFVRGIFAGRSTDEVNALGVDFASTVASSWMRSDVVDRLRWHQEQDHVVLVVSASLAPYVEPLGDLLEVDGVLCTQLAVIDDVFTGDLVGKNCRGAEKVTRIQQWCAEAGLSISSVLFAYGDSTGDRPMVDLAEHGVMVSRRDLERMPVC